MRTPLVVAGLTAIVLLPLVVASRTILSEM
jgi:hypothetical protein